ncbi:MAG: lysylphosphatidylglycerol synthase domain-containing protein [Kineosporiaceae bacterium]
MTEPAAGAPGPRTGGAVARLTGLAGAALKVSGSPAARVAVVLVAAGLAVWALVAEWDGVRAAASRVSPLALVAALAVTLASVGAAGMVWRAVLGDLGSWISVRVAARIFFIGQLGKYLPGSVWPVVMQAELGADAGLPRRRTASATVVFMLVALASALLVVVGCLPLVDVVPDGFELAVLLVVPVLVVLHPRVLVPGIDRVLGVLGREPLGRPTTVAGTVRALAWAVASWVGAGGQVAVLAVALGAPADADTVLLAIGGYTLAWAVGFVVVVAPAGAGPREAALLAVLSPVLDRGGLLVLVLASRVLFTLADLMTAGAAVLAARRRRA